jgi:hypothetical protein
MSELDPIDPSDTRSLSTPELIRQIGSKALLLVREEIHLVRQEAKEDLRSEITAIKGFAAAAVTGIAMMVLLLMAAVFALGSAMTPVSAALSLAGVALVLTIALAALAWHKHVQKPLDLARKNVKEDIEFAKEQVT